MKHYEKYKAEDLLADPWFLAWVKHGQSEAEQFWEEFQQQHPDRRAVVLLAKDMAEALSNRPGRLSAEQARVEVAQIMRLTRHLPATRRTPVLHSLRHPFGILAAAVGLMIGSIWMLWLLPSNQLSRPNPSLASHEPGKPPQWVNQINGTSQPVLITLPDSSRMTLFPNSRASYPPAFSPSKREIYLKGEALFAVVHDSSRPFLVMSGPLITKVLGTRFRVRTLPNESRIIVSVQRGKVSVYSRANLARSNLLNGADVSGVVLTANQQVVYQTKPEIYHKQLVLQPTLISPDQFVFQDTPMSTVFDRLQKGFGITIIYDAFLFRQCTVTASLTDVSLRDQLELICASIGATYEIVDTQIIVSGKGCQ